MSRIWEAIKKIGVVVATALSAVALVLLGKESWRRSSRKDSYLSDGDCLDGSTRNGHLTDDEIEEKANAKKDEILERIDNIDARELSENYGTVCDAITDGKLRFRERCGKEIPRLRSE